MFLKRQKEVSREFSEYIAKNVLNSQRVWQSIMGGTKSDEFRRIISRNVPLPSGIIAGIIKGLQDNVGAIGSHPLHYYTDIRLNLQVIYSLFLDYFWIIFELFLVYFWIIFCLLILIVLNCLDIF